MIRDEKSHDLANLLTTEQSVDGGAGGTRDERQGGARPSSELPVLSIEDYQDNGGIVIGSPNAGLPILSASHRGTSSMSN